MGSRKPHTKSRTGCLECKRRHTKCDEQQPRCSSCRRLGEICSLSLSTPTSASTTLDIIQQFSYLVPNLKDFNSESARLALDNLKLLHHFSIVTYAALDTVVAQRKLWQEVTVEFGFQHQFVLRGVLAISSSHLASLNPDLRASLLLEASLHHNRALGDFRIALINVNDNNCTAIFAFACLTVVHAFVAAQIQTAEDPVPDFLNCIRLIRGANSVLQPHWAQLMTTELAPMLDNGWRRGVVGWAPTVLRLKALVGSLPDLDDSATHSAYIEAIDQLHTVFLEVSAVAGEDQAVLALLFTWPISLSEKFLLLLSSRQPAVMVILAHFAGLFHSIGDCWWLAKWHEHIISAANATLGADFGAWLS